MVRCVVEIVLVILQLFMQLCYIAAIFQVFYVVMDFCVVFLFKVSSLDHSVQLPEEGPHSLA